MIEAPDETQAAGERGLAARALASMSAIAPSEWDACVPPGSGPLRHGYLSAWERSELRGLASRPLAAYEGDADEPVAVSPGHIYDLDLATVRSPGAVAPVRTVRRIWDGFLLARTYELGSPTPLTNPFCVCRDDIRPRAVEALVDTALDEANRSGADFLLVQNFASRGGSAGDELEKRGFAWVAMLPTAVVDLRYGSFDDYLAAMRSQYRRRAKQAFERSEHLRVERLERFDTEADELARLWTAIYERAAEVKRERLTPEFFRAASKLDPVSVLALRRDDGSIASFGLLFADSPWLFFMQCGFEAEAARDEAAYFRLLYEIVRLGIDDGFDQVDLGMTTLEPKLDVGAVPVQLYAWIKHRNPLFQRIIRALGAGPLKPPEAAPRKVFKEPPPEPEELLAARPTRV